MKSIRKDVPWTSQISDAEWEPYRPLLERLCDTSIPFALGGAHALALYTHTWRPTKDLDIYIEKKNAELLRSILDSIGFIDYYAVDPYDREWIYRATLDRAIVDIIWAMANQRAQVTQDWLDRRVFIPLRGLTLPVLGIEEFTWIKLYVMQRNRCDWPDLLNIIENSEEEIDWSHLLYRLDDDWGLLAGVIALFRWVSPKRARDLPPELWKYLDVLPTITEGQGQHRPELLDRRDWFRPHSKP